MRRQSRFSYVAGVLLATLATSVTAQDTPVPPPDKWLAGAAQPSSPVSWQSPLTNESRDTFQKEPPHALAPLVTSGKRAPDPGTPSDHCSSTGPNGVAACAAMIAVSAAVHSVSD